MELASTRRQDYRFSTQVRVRFAETDAQGVVYNGSYFTYLEVGRVEYFRALMVKFQGSPYDLTVAEACCRYHSPAIFDDLLDIYVRVADMKNTSFAFHYLLINERTGAAVATARTVQVVLDPGSKKPVKIPPRVRESIEGFEGRRLRKG